MGGMKAFDTAEMLERLRKAGGEILPERAHLYLFGSRARGDAKEDSDWDLLLLLDKPRREFSRDYDRYAWPFVEIGFEYGQVFNFSIHTLRGWEEGRGHPFYRNVMKERIEIA
jgi:predicted nucleotidyltransferase